MVKLELSTYTLATLVAGMYCSANSINVLAIPESIWFQIAENLKPFLSKWDYSVMTFEQWISTFLLVYPKDFITEGELEDLKKNTIYWEQNNGNVILSISMDMRGVLNDE